MKTRKEISGYVKKTLINNLDIKESDINENFSLYTDFCISSLDAIDLWLTLEERYEIEIDELDAEKLTTVKRIIDYIFVYLNF